LEQHNELRQRETFAALFFCDDLALQARHFTGAPLPLFSVIAVNLFAEGILRQDNVPGSIFKELRIELHHKRACQGWTQ
jgi:hypothetical protein